MTSQPPKPRVFASTLFILGLLLLIGGLRLAFLGGSLYYLAAGFIVCLAAVELWRGRKSGAWIYGAFLVATIVWSLDEVGFDAWALMPRIAMWLVLGLWLLLPRTRRALNQAQPFKPLRQSRVAQVSVGVAVVLIVIGLWQNRTPAPESIERAVASTTVGDSEWRHYGRTSAGTRYAPFSEITPDNVTQLKKVWTFRTGITDVFKATPLQVGDKLFVCTAGNVVIAIDAENGAERWRFDPKVNTKSIGFTTTCRGVTYYKSPQPLAQCTERILTATTDARMFAVDANDGKPCGDFGRHEGKLGEISLLPGMGEVLPGYYYVTSPATIARNVAVLGGWVLDNNRTGEPSGVVRAFDPITGQLKWAWDAGRPTAHSLPGANETYTRGTPNAWSLFSSDDELGLVYIPTGNATPDYFGAHRKPELEKYASSIVALDATTGDVRWFFQTTHHDIWDYDVPSQPVLTTMPNKNGVATPAVIVPTKRGELFVFDRRDGTPLAAIEERPVPQDAVPGEWLAKTQPFATGMPSFAGPPLTERDAWGITPIDQMFCRIAFKELKYEGPFTPQSTQGTIEYPGFAGGMNWGSVTVHEGAQLLVVQSLHIANRVILTPRKDFKDTMPVALGGPQTGTPYAANSFPWLSSIFVPCQRPPYGELAVVDLKTRKTVWQRPLGTANELGPLGLGIKIPLPMGVPFSAGTIVTQSGLIFVGGTMDRYMRAIDVYTGTELWRDYLPGQPQATPMSYLGPTSKRQFVVITVPGKQQPIEHTGDGVEIKASSADGGYIIAYSL
jgi:quinoprotein glucose dehydrogenase